MGAWHTGGVGGTGQGQATPWLSALSYFGVLCPESTFWVQVASWPSVTKTGPRVLWGQRAAFATCSPLPDPVLGQLPPRQTSTAGQALPADPPPAHRVLLRPQRGNLSPALGPTDHLSLCFSVTLAVTLETPGSDTCTPAAMSNRSLGSRDLRGVPTLSQDGQSSEPSYCRALPKSLGWEAPDRRLGGQWRPA